MSFVGEFATICHLKSFLKLRLWESHKIKIDVYSVTSKQVGDFFKFLWPFQKTWTLIQDLSVLHNHTHVIFIRTLMRLEIIFGFIV